ncbi:F0F1 ATP synthase subunit A [uncultured Ruminococcus sp.]|uniref:F0F1 ATP synthase subunit A n=1 Tax=uncultured Ruminococcus sp. TaxID=165186 RepID=UPI0025E31ABE|nr:F0F1 ATP synthase subunit A [uncultured Ruminococcus sp.]
MIEKISQAISEAMENKIAFRIPIFGGIPVPESCVVTWIIMAVLVLASILLTRNLKLVPDRKQMLLESFIGFLRNFFKEQLGEKGMQYFPYMATVIIFIGFSNIIGLFGLVPPTKDLNVTAALAIMSIILVEYAGIRAKGAKGWLKGFTQPVAIITPLNIMEVAIKPLSLCMRLFGNVLASFIIMEMIKVVCPLFIPVALSAYFDIFDGFIQAYVFVFLTSLYINEAIEDE